MRRLSPLAVLFACQADVSSAPDDTSAPTDTASAAPAVVDLSVFQAVEVPLVRGGEAITTAARNAPLIAGREAAVRARLDVPAGFSGGALEVAVDVVAGGVTESFTAAVDADGVAVARVPAAALDEGAGLALRVLAGGAEVARSPDAGEAPLDLVVTDVMKVRLVPFEVNGFVPDTSPAVVEGYRAALMAVYPVTGVEISVAPVETWTEPFDLGDINVRVGQIQEEAMFAGEVEWDVYYYGMATGVATRDEYQGITGTSEDGKGSDTAPYRVYFAAGAAFGDQRSEDTLIHEIGHVWGLPHAPCQGEDNPDPDFPYAGGAIGVEGWDNRTGAFVPPDQMDMMTYCYPRWISDYNYAKLVEHALLEETLNGPR
jgi:hypothetical protein